MKCISKICKTMITEWCRNQECCGRCLHASDEAPPPILAGSGGGSNLRSTKKKESPMRPHILSVIVAMLVLSQPILAQEAGLSDAYYRTVTVMNLDAEARRVVTQDRVQTTLVIEKTGKTPTEVQAFINSAMQQTLAAANKVSSVKASTGYYNVYKQYQPETTPLSAAERERKAVWQGQQSLVLDSADKDALLKLAGSIQEHGFTMQGLNFYLSREASDKLKDALTAEALTTIKTRAQAIAAQLGMPNVRFARVSIGGGGYQPPVMYARGMMAKAEMMADAMPAPAAQAGESEVALSVNVEVHLSK